MTERLRFILVIAVLAVVGFAGTTALRSRDAGDGGGNSELAKKIFASDSVPLERGKFSFEVKASVEGVPQLSTPLAVSGSGAFDMRGRRPAEFDFDGGIAAGAFNERFGARVARGVLYVAQGGVFYRVARVNPVRRSEGEGQEIPGSVFTNIRHEGTETLDGVETDHVSAEMDVAAFIEAMERQSGEGAQMPAVARMFLDQAIREAKLEGWIGKDGKTRKIAFSLGAEIPDTLRQQAAGMTKADLDVEVSFTDVGKPQRIAAPRNAREGGLEGAFGRAFSAGIESGVNGSKAERAKAASGPVRKADPSRYDARTREYLACVAGASKPAALRKCIAGLR